MLIGERNKFLKLAWDLMVCLKKYFDFECLIQTGIPVAANELEKTFSSNETLD